MADTAKFEVLNAKAFERAAKLAPKRVFGSVRREFKRAGKKFSTMARRLLLSGPPGIFLPAVQPKKGARKAIKQVQSLHIRTKTGGRKSIFLVAYTSVFLTFHREKIKQAFVQMFHQMIPAIQQRVLKEVARITQAVLNKGLRDLRR